MKLLAVLFCLSSFGFSFAALAEGEAFTDLSRAVKKQTVERMGRYSNQVTVENAIKGNQTGGSCKTASDCIVGIKTGEKDVTCISAKEGTPTPPPGPGGLKCTCLTSVFACGYAFPK